jgi:hypothetical protein
LQRYFLQRSSDIMKSDHFRNLNKQVNKEIPSPCFFFDKGYILVPILCIQIKKQLWFRVDPSSSKKSKSLFNLPIYFCLDIGHFIYKHSDQMSSLNSCATALLGVIFFVVLPPLLYTFFIRKTH